MNISQITAEAWDKIEKKLNYYPTAEQRRDGYCIILSAIEKATAAMKHQLDDALERELEATQERDDANVRAAHASEFPENMEYGKAERGKLQRQSADTKRLEIALSELVEQFDVYRAGWLGNDVWRDRIGLPQSMNRAKELLAAMRNET